MTNKFEECEECLFGDGSLPNICDHCEDAGLFEQDSPYGESFCGEYRTILIKTREAA